MNHMRGRRRVPMRRESPAQRVRRLWARCVASGSVSPKREQVYRVSRVGPYSPEGTKPEGLTVMASAVRRGAGGVLLRVLVAKKGGEVFELVDSMEEHTIHKVEAPADIDDAKRQLAREAMVAQRWVRTELLRLQRDESILERAQEAAGDEALSAKHFGKALGFNVRCRLGLNNPQLRAFLARKLHQHHQESQ